MPLDPPLGPGDHTTGPDDAVVHLVHYGDFECPYSKDVFDIVAEVRERHPGRVRLAFRHFPVRSHPHALGAAVAADAAGRQGAFWPFHDRLYGHQLQLRPDQLVAHAEALGLDGAAVRAALDDEGARAPILAQKRAGVRAGVRSTLALWIGDVWYEEDALEGALVEHVIRPLQAAER